MKVINFFGSPGSGKTTLAMEFTSILKKHNIDTGISLEHVKEYIYTDNLNLLSYQNYIFSCQERQLAILRDSNEIEFAVTDAPLLLSSFFAPQNYPIFFKELVFEIFNSYDNINFFINRKHPYSHQGRIHNEEQSLLANNKLKLFLINNNIQFYEINSTDNLLDFPLKTIFSNRVLDYQLNKKNR